MSEVYTEHNKFTLLHKHLVYGDVNTVSVPKSNEISDESIEVVTDKLYWYIQNLKSASAIANKRYVLISSLEYTEEYRFLIKANNLLSVPYIKEEIGNAAVVQKGKYCGTFLKRLQAMYYKQFKIKLDSDFLGLVGGIIGQVTGTGLYHLVFDYDNRWHAGDFGDNGSCYWGCYSQAPEIIKEMGGGAVMLFKQPAYDFEYALARCWFVPYPDKVFIFNCYSTDSLQLITMSRIISTLLGCSYKKVDLTNEEQDDGVFYINGGHGYLLGAVDVIQNITTHDFEQEIDESKECDRCSSHHDVEWVGARIDQNLCNSCRENVVMCDDCDNEYWEDSSYYIESIERTVCAYCYRNYDFCHVCLKVYHDRDMFAVEGNWYCGKCYSENFSQCEECKVKEIPKDEITYIESESLAVCYDCLSKLFDKCTKCDEWFRKTDLVDFENQLLCTECNTIRIGEGENEQIKLL